MNPQQPPPKIQLSSTTDYREHYANSVQVRVSLWDFFLLFGTINQTSQDSVSISNHQGIFLTPHPPGVMAYLALVWKIFGYSIPAARVAMLLIASVGVLFSFLLAIRLSRGAPGAPAFAAAAFLMATPMFYTQSMMAQLDMPA